MLYLIFSATPQLWLVCLILRKVEGIYSWGKEQEGVGQMKKLQFQIWFACLPCIIPFSKKKKKWDSHSKEPENLQLHVVIKHLYHILLESTASPILTTDGIISAF